jgi:ubiquinol-cytochrome c reductase cytochrome c subunit
MQRIKTLAVSALFAATLIAGAHGLSAQTTAPPPGDVKRGHDLFVAQGCFECHNYQGQAAGSRAPGARPGPNIAPGPIPYAAFVKQMRAPRSAMPVYDSHLINDQGIADIYAYLLSQPAPKNPATIPILAAVTTGSGPSGPPSATARGAEVFAANCAACHGAQGQGGVGSSLKSESARKDTAAVTAFVKNPSGAMPKLFPSVLNESDVAAVAAYVETLK